jgi:hypothetical protein
MSNDGTDIIRTSPPPRPRHQLSRSITELSSPIHLHRNGSMRRDHSRRRDKDRDRDDLISVIQRARTPGQIPQPRVSFEGSRSEGMTPNMSPDASRRTSVLLVPGDDGLPVPAAAPAQLASALAPAVVASRPSMENERQRAAAREKCA